MTRTDADFSEELDRKPESPQLACFTYPRTTPSKLRTDLKELDCRVGFPASP